jgi:hypothetical protein
MGEWLPPGTIRSRRVFTHFCRRLDGIIGGSLCDGLLALTHDPNEKALNRLGLGDDTGLHDQSVFAEPVQSHLDQPEAEAQGCVPGD